MKVLSLIPRIMAVEPAVNWSGTEAKNSLFIYPFEDDFETRCLEAAEEYNPDLILMFAFGEGPYCPNTDKIRLIRDKFNIVYMASDGACRGLWPVLKRFRDADCFSAMVNIDGSHHWPEGTIDLVTLSPLDQSRYSNRTPIKDRPYRLGFMGGEGAIGNPRRDISQILLGKNVLTMGKRDERWGSNQQYTDFMLNSQAIINFPQTGLGNLHIKARALEAGLAGAVLFEQSCSFLKDYVPPEEHYFQWTTTEDVTTFLETPLDIREKMAENFREKVLPLTDPDKFVEKVMNVL